MRHYGRTMTGPRKFSGVGKTASSKTVKLPPLLANLSFQRRGGVTAVGKQAAIDQGIDLKGPIEQFNAESQARIQQALESGDLTGLSPLEISWVNAQVEKTTAELEAQAALGDQASEEILAAKAQATEEAQVSEILALDVEKKKAQRMKVAKNAGAVLIFFALGYGIFKLTEK